MILIGTSRYYAEVSALLEGGARRALLEAGWDYEVREVEGALELPLLGRWARDEGEYEGYVALGCVIRGETSHYDVVAGESARGLMDLGLSGRFIGVGNGILTVDNLGQAMLRADLDGKDKGGAAVRGCLSLLERKLLDGV